MLQLLDGSRENVLTLFQCGVNSAGGKHLYDVLFCAAFAPA